MAKVKLPVTEDLDFHYLLTLMPPLHDMPEFAWLPELYSIIDIDSFLKLCRYAGGEYIRIPTVEELEMSMSALQWFYNVYIKKSNEISEIPLNLCKLVNKIKEVYDVRDRDATIS